jgi:hypothetical protein
MNPAATSGSGDALRKSDEAKKPSQKVVLQVLREIVCRYERGAAELCAEFELPAITAELLMLVCLAAPEVDDLIVGFIRDDLRVLSLSEQTRQMADRDVGLLERDSSRWMQFRSGSLGQQLNLRNRAEADARIAQGRSSELEDFIAGNTKIYEQVHTMRHADVVRWVMLALMRETKARKKGSAVILEWREKLGPELRRRLEKVQTQFGNPSRENSKASPVHPNEKKVTPRLGRGIPLSM